jgi:hypothetical protein
LSLEVSSFNVVRRGNFASTKMKEDELGGICSMYVKVRNGHNILDGKPKLKVISKWNLGKQGAKLD